MLSPPLLSPPILSPIAPKQLEPINEDDMFVGDESPVHLAKS
tara:strand:+ start:1878 stop:2003 length:126 start_codon:yes stop_codon:yes gene_type:complete